MDIDIAPAGEMSERKINVQARINIIIKNTANAKIAAQITLKLLKLSKAAKLLVINIPKPNDNEEEEDSEDEEKDLRNAFMDSHFLNQRTVLGVETVRLSMLLLYLIHTTQIPRKSSFTSTIIK